MARLIIPDEAVLGRVRYRVYQRATKEMKRGAWLGLMNPDAKTIHVDPEQSRREVEATWVHELLHAIWPTGVVDEKTEEKIIRKLEYRLRDAVAHGYLRAKGEK